MNDFLKIVKDKRAFDDIVKDYSLLELFKLRDDEDFETPEYKSNNPGLMKLNKEFCEILPILDLAVNDPKVNITRNQDTYCPSLYYHRTLCASKAIELWKKYKKIYTIDKNWYKDFISTEDIKIDFALLNKLPFDSFYIDLSNVEMRHTNHYANVIGVIVNIIDYNTIHLVVVDSDNVQYNPIDCYAKKDYYYVEHTLNGYVYKEIFDKSTFLSRINDSTNMTYKDICDVNNYIYKPMYDCFPKSWLNNDTGTVHFVDFLISNNSQNKTLTAHNTYDCFGWSFRQKNVSLVEMNDMHSPILNQIMRFTILFLYFLHSKTKDIVLKNDTNQSFSTNTNKSVEKWSVGERYGEKIRTLQRKINLYGTKITGDPRNHPRAYVRCAHLHNYWHGSGKDKHLEVHWLEPTYCNGSISDIVTVVNQVSDEDLKQSNGEHIISTYLDAVGIEYTSEKSVNIKNHNRRYDFEIIFNNKKMFIEFDGEQHFRPVEKFGGEKAFKERQIADFNKNDYAKKNRIPLLRIRYDQIEKIPELIDLFLEKPSLEKRNPLLDNKSYYKI